MGYEGRFQSSQSEVILERRKSSGEREVFRVMNKHRAVKTRR